MSIQHKCTDSAVPTVFGSDLSVGKQLLALDSLIKLNSQVADEADLYKLINILLMTISGQFAVINSFAIIRDPGRISEIPLYYATGKYERSNELSDVTTYDIICDYYSENKDILHTQDLDENKWKYLHYILTMHDISVLVSIERKGLVYGVIGLGRKVTGNTYNKSELDLLRMLINGITPFVTNLSIEFFDLFNSVTQGVLLFNNKNRLIRINETGLNILYAFNTSLLKTDNIYSYNLDSIFPNQIFDSWSSRIANISIEQRLVILDNLIARNGKEESIYNGRVNIINKMSGSQYELLLVLDDITEEKARDQHLYNLEKFAEKGVMVASISHELNNFLALIQSSLELARFSFNKDDSEGMKSYLKKADDSIDTMKKFINGLLDYSKFNSKRTLANLNTIISDITLFAKIQKKFRSIQFNIDLKTNLPLLEMNSDMLAQLLMNLLNNAADAISDAGRTIGNIVIKTFSDNWSIGFSIHDNGIGIKPEVKDKLFNTHLTTKKDGHGFGLITCSKILSEHNATVDIDSIVGEGSTFRIIFPMQTEHCAAKETDKEEELITKSK